jgi:hypothetical protein
MQITTLHWQWRCYWRKHSFPRGNAIFLVLYVADLPLKIKKTTVKITPQAVHSPPLPCASAKKAPRNSATPGVTKASLAATAGGGMGPPIQGGAERHQRFQHHQVQPGQHGRGLCRPVADRLARLTQRKRNHHQHRGATRHFTGKPAGSEPSGCPGVDSTAPKDHSGSARCTAGAKARRKYGCRPVRPVQQAG